ncbi:MAG: inorganic diphosphatase [Oricola sp.]|jgi:inorganic pyrophosphatase|nr:inorganic diphosphatase [Oricola sp.]
MDLSKITPGVNAPKDVNVVVEVPLGGEPIKYEIDKASGAMFVDRFLYTATRYPCNYGFIPQTLADDGDPVDVMVMGNRPLVPGAVVGARPVGVLIMEDEAGMDEKILAVPSSRLTRYYSKIHNYTDLPDILIERISHFFEHYKDLEPNKWVKIVEWRGIEEAERLILEGIEAEAKRKAG